MNISLVKYSEEFMRNGLKRWIGGEVTLAPGENAMDGIKTLERLIHAAFYGEKSIPTQPPPPEPYLSDEQLPEIQVEKVSREDTVNGILADIEKCTTVPSLEFYKILTTTYPEITPSYRIKYEQLKAVELSKAKSK